ncbi:MAG: PAS domain S-box protein [archaeon]|nr:PAS domain S-box protein [archaeon]
MIVKDLKHKLEDLKIINSLPDATLVIDQKGTIIIWNSALERLTGIKSEDMIGNGNYEYSIPFYGKRRQILIDLCLIPEKTRNKLYPFIEKDGDALISEIYTSLLKRGLNILGKARPIYDKKKIIGAIETFHNITNRVRAEELLAEEADKFSRIFHQSNDAIFLLENNRIVDVNQKALEIFGYTQEEIDQLEEFPKLIPNGKEEWNKQLYIVESKKVPIKFELELRKRSGELFLADISLSDIKIKDSILVQNIIRDITERKKTEKKLKKSEEKYQNLFNNAQVGLFSSNFSDGKLIECNEIFAKLVGYDTIAECLEDFIPSEHYVHIEDRKKMFEFVKEKGRIENYEVLGTKKDGTPFWASFSVKLFSERQLLEGACIDITEKKKADEQILKSEKKYRLLATNTLDVIWVTDPNFNFTYVNDSVFQLLGYTPSEITKINGSELMDQENQMKFRESSKTIISRFEKGKIISQKIETQAIHKNRSLVDCEVILNPDFDENGTFLGFHGRTTDISARKQAEQKLKESENMLRILNEELEQRVKERTLQLQDMNKELEAFSYSVSHDLRAPLRVISGLSDIIYEDNFDILDENSKEYLNRIRSGCKKMGVLTKKLLELSRFSGFKIKSEQFNLSSLVNDIIIEIKNQDQNRNVTFKVEDGLVIRADKQLITIAIQNLLENAWKYTKNKINAEIEFGLKEQDDKKIYFVRDNGIGFDMAFINKLFEPFQRLHSKDEFEGSGIGLATVRRIINRHRGKIWAEGIIDKGSTFYFTLS